MRARPSVVQLFQIGSQMSSKSSEACKCPTPQHSPSKHIQVVLAMAVQCAFRTIASANATDQRFCVLCIEQASHPAEMWASFGVLGAISPLPLSSLAVTAKSLLQKSGLSDQHWNKHNGEGLFGDFAQAAMASTHLIEHKVNSTTSAQRAQGAQRMARQLWGDTLSSQRHESWQSLMPTVTSAQTVEYASPLSC